jgi:hypothetical protein
MDVRKKKRGRGGVERGRTPSQRGRMAPQRARPTWLTLQQKNTWTMMPSS